jgi:hypothetical protein
VDYRPHRIRGFRLRTFRQLQTQDVDVYRLVGRMFNILIRDVYHLEVGFINHDLVGSDTFGLGGSNLLEARLTLRGDGNITCPPRAWSGPPLQLGFNDLLQGTFFSGSVRPAISRIQLHLPDGRAITATPIKGHILIAIPSKYARAGHNGSYIVPFDRDAHEVARGRPEN